MSDIKKPRKHKKHIVDVEEPGTSAPSPTSKPVIVSNRPLLQDPMMVVAPANGESSEKPAEKRPEVMLAAEKKPVITPSADIEEQSIGHTDEPTATPDPSEDMKPTDPEENEAAARDESEIAARAPQPEAEASEAPPANLNQADESGTAPPETLPTGDANQVDGSKQPPAKQADAEAAARSKHEAEVQELVESKRYALPIRTIEQRQSKRFVVLGAALAGVLIIIWIDIALDAGIIKLGGLKPLTHFFSN